ncbi:prephenate dehydratase [Archangium violaceum]|uniref:prephenate dehydratase n=1 Tax=Archangium violaceum TaxID=83451 RepID=UPI00194E01A3|nr:prephenate dehydratase [Archangium violaceum]QRN99187.1 prephenate dehydratase [Archangium violaceum]
METIAYLGPPGTFSEEAALAWGGSEAHLLPLASLPAVVTAVETGAASSCVLPLENSLEGAVTTTLDLLIRETALQVRSELVLPVRHMLAVRPGLQLDEVRVLHAHPQALGQSRRFVERCLPDVAIVAALSNAAALTDALADSRPAAAISTRRAIELHSAAILAHDIQDHPNNQTRFILLGAEDAAPTGNDRTSLCFAMSENRAGSLLDALLVLAEARINMTRLESRPAKELLGEYIFLADIEGHRLEPHVAAALQRMRQQTSFFKVFGSYPRYRPPAGEPGVPRRTLST